MHNAKEMMLDDVAQDASAWMVAGAGGPGVLLCHPWWGLSQGTRNLGDVLADAGFLVVMPDLYAGTVVHTPEGAEALRSRDPLAVRQARFDAAVAALRDHPHRQGDTIGTVGLSLGGSWALDLVGDQPDLVSAVVLYYALSDVPDDGLDHVAVLAHLAGHDEFDSDEDYEAFLTELRDRGATLASYHYPGTEHWFAESDVEGYYDPSAAKLALDRTITCLQTALTSSW